MAIFQYFVPFSTPVLHRPVSLDHGQNAVLISAPTHAPADDLDGVAARRLARRALVDAAGVVLEVAVYLC